MFGGPDSPPNQSLPGPRLPIPPRKPRAIMCKECGPCKNPKWHKACENPSEGSPGEARAPARRNTQKPKRVSEAQTRKQMKEAAAEAARAVKRRWALNRMRAKYNEPNSDGETDEGGEGSLPMEFPPNQRAPPTKNREVFVTTDDVRTLGTGKTTNKRCPARPKGSKPVEGVQASVEPFLATQGTLLGSISRGLGVDDLPFSALPMLREGLPPPPPTPDATCKHCLLNTSSNPRDRT